MAAGEVTKDTGTSSVSPQAGEITPSTYQEELSAIMLGYTQYNFRDTSKQEKLVSGTNIRTINGVSVLGSGNISITQSIDTALSTTSTNPVQNKVVAAALNNKLGKEDVIDVKGGLFVIKGNSYYMNIRGDGYVEMYDNSGDRVDAFYFPNSDYDSDDMLAKMSDVDNATINKVDAVAGKGLSTNDYTTAEKNKLAALYTKTEIDDKLDALSSGSGSGATRWTISTSFGYNGGGLNSILDNSTMSKIKSGDIMVDKNGVEGVIVWATTPISTTASGDIGKDDGSITYTPWFVVFAANGIYILGVYYGSNYSYHMWKKVTTIDLSTFQ